MTATILAGTAQGKGAFCCHQLWQSGCPMAFSNDLNFGSRHLGAMVIGRQSTYHTGTTERLTSLDGL